MIKVLQNWNEIGQAIHYLEQRGLPLHGQPQKNWDHALLTQLLIDADRSSTILDMGCGPAFSLQLTHRLGFHDLTGIDLRIWPIARLILARAAWRSRRLAMPWRLRRRDICASGLPPASIDFISCISVIEHGVPLVPLAAECARLLRPGGRLLVTTDFWDYASRPAPLRPQPDWQPFTPESVTKLIATFRDHGLSLVEASEIPACDQPTVHWQGNDYTFIALALCQGVTADGGVRANREALTVG